MSDARPKPPVDTATVHRLLLHEALVHAVPDRVLRDLGDGLLLYDRHDPEPFWNRLEAVRWPSEPDAFDRRLAEVGVLFASIGRQPHIWLLPPHDAPDDIAARLLANGFVDTGSGHLMVASGAVAGRRSAEALARPPAPGVTIERSRELRGAAANEAARASVEVLVAAFEVGDDRRVGVIAETVASLADPRFMHYLIRLDGVPAAVARRATFEGISYLSSIGTHPAARGRGLARLVTATAMADAAAAGSEWVHLGVFADNLPAFALYERLGFVPAGEPGPDLLLVG